MPLFDTIITVTLNPAIDRIMEIAGFQVGGHQRGETVARVPAGKGVNVSRALSELGVASIATGFVGRGQLEEYEASFHNSLVRPQFLAVEGRTRENVTVIDTTTATETHLRDKGLAPTPADVVRLRNKINLLAKPGRLFVFSGSLPTGVDTAGAVKLIDVAISKGARVAVDGPGELLAALRDRSLWLIKPNRKELAEMVAASTGGAEVGGQGDAQPSLDDKDILRIASEFTDHVDVVIVSCGAAGGFLLSAQRSLRGRVDFDTTLARSSVGCGDCLLGGFIAARCEGMDEEESYRRALAVATAAAMEVVPGQFARKNIESLLGLSIVEPVQ